MGDTANAYQRIHQLKLKSLEKTPEFEQATSFRDMIITTSAELALRGKRTEAFTLLANFTNRKNRVRAYGQVAYSCQLKNKPDEGALFLDSANIELNRLKSFGYNGDDFRLPLVYVLALQNNKVSEKKALEYLGFMERFNRANGISFMATAYAHIREYYKASQVVPVYASYKDKVWVFFPILFKENLRKGNNTKEWETYTRIQERYWIYGSGFTQNDLLPD